MIDRKIIENWHDQRLARIIFGYYDLIKSELGLQQCLDELQAVKNEIGDRRFSNFYEIGSDDGGSLWVYSNLFVNENGGKVNAIDITIKPSLLKVASALSKKGFEMQIINRPSLKVDVQEEIEFLHIDGDHSYKAARSEFDKFYPLVKKGGVILLHDTLLWDGTIKLRKELEKQFNCKTFSGSILISGNFGHPDKTRKSTGITMIIK